MNSHFSSHPHIYSLALAENNALQALLPEFTLSRNSSNGTNLGIAFNNATNTIRRRESKSVIEKTIPEFCTRKSDIQEQIEDVIFREKDRYHHSPSQEHPFPFRYCSGGTLPILTLDDGHDYYVLFYRDADPCGWNIANGSADTLEELLDPTIIIERELREELILLNFEEGIDYNLHWGTGKSLHRPEFDTARQQWQQMLTPTSRKWIPEFDGRQCWVQSLGGPDELNIEFDGQKQPSIGDCYVNINAIDFGIEIDRIGHLKMQGSTNDLRLLDGEIIDHVLLNRPVGLFEVDRLHRQLESNHPQTFVPDFLFYSGEREQRNPFEIVENDFIPRLATAEIRSSQAMETWKNKTSVQKFGLCPVTRQIARRHRELRLGPARTMSNPSRELDLIGFMLSTCARANQIFRVLSSDYGTDGEIEFKRDDGKASGRRIYVQLKSGDSHLRIRNRDNKEIIRVKESHLDYWQNHPADVYLVVRQACGKARWMNVTHYLKQRGDNTDCQIEFEGQPLNEASVLRVREELGIC